MAVHTESIAFDKSDNLNVLNVGTLLVSGQFVLKDYYFKNRSAGERFLKFYDIAATPTSSDIPYRVISLSPGESGHIQTAIHHQLGFGIRATTGLADNDNGAPSANDVIFSYSGN